jgi:hypothetical protein
MFNTQTWASRNRSVSVGSCVVAKPTGKPRLGRSLALPRRRQRRLGRSLALPRRRQRRLGRSLARALREVRQALNTYAR